jgi:c-di-GMP-binding flagellar brake protein YcgR
LPRKKLPQERRKWQRLPLAVPVFIRCSDKAGNETLEFATAVNVSAGGMLVAVRRMLPASVQYSLEIPSAPMPDSEILAKSSRKLRAHSVRVVHAKDHHLLGFKFSRALLI